MDTNLLPKMSAWLKAHQEELLTDLAGLAAIPTVVKEGEGGGPYGKALADAVLYMGALADRYGFSWCNHDWHCVSITYGEGDRQLGIWGHLDVVPPGEGWIYPPFGCTKVKNFLIGRGVQDNKGPSMVSLYVLRYLKENGIRSDFQIRLIYGCQEETGMQDVTEYLKREKAPDFSLVADCGFPVCYGEKGILNAVLESGPLSPCIEALSGGTAANIIPGEGSAVVSGKLLSAQGISGHSAFPEGTVNAFCSLGKLLLNLTDLGQTDREAFRFLADAGSDGYGKALGIACSDEESGPMTCSPTLLSLENGRMRVSMNLRYPITAKGPDILQRLKEKAAGYGLSILQAEDSSPNYVDPEGAWVKFLTQACSEVMGKPQKPYAMSGGTYARKLPCAVGFGSDLPRDISVLGLPKGHGEYHQPDESQNIDNLWAAWKIYTYTICRLIEEGLPNE